MSEVTIRIGGRPFTVACQPGEEDFLQAAARMLDAEAAALVDQLGKMADAQMLLMSGLMLADRTAGLEDRLRIAEAAAETPAGPAAPAARDNVLAALSGIAGRAEALADVLDDMSQAQ